MRLATGRDMSMVTGVLENENTQIAEDWLEFLVAREACSHNSSGATAAYELQMKLQDLGQKLNSLARKQVQFRKSVERLASTPAPEPLFFDPFPSSLKPASQNTSPGNWNDTLSGQPIPHTEPDQEIGVDSGSRAAKNNILTHMFDRKH